MSEPVKKVRHPFDPIVPTAAQQVKLEEVNSAFKFVYEVLKGLRVEATNPAAPTINEFVKYARRELHQSLIDARQAVVWNAEIKEQAEKKGGE